jgi:hypothetical protein
LDITHGRQAGCLGKPSLECALCQSGSCNHFLRRYPRPTLLVQR